MAAVRTAFPQEEGEKDIAYARRLNLNSQRNLPGARIADTPLTFHELASISGLNVRYLNYDPRMHPPPGALTAISRAYPMEKSESAVDYAVRLNEHNQNTGANASVDGKPLTLEHLVRLSGRRASVLRQHPSLRELGAT